MYCICRFLGAYQSQLRLYQLNYADTGLYECHIDNGQTDGPWDNATASVYLFVPGSWSL